MTDLRQRFQDMLADEPAPGFSVEGAVTAGRRARRRWTLATTSVALVGTAATVSAAVAVPLALGPSGHRATITTGAQPSPPSKCEILAKHQPALVRVTVGGKKGYLIKSPSSAPLPPCPSPEPNVNKPAPTPSGPAYHYSESPQSVSTRLGDHLAARVKDLGLTVSYTRPFAQETSTLQHNHPSYFGGNVDIKEANGYGDIGVQVIHRRTTLQPISNSCDPSHDSSCQITKRPDGSVLQTDKVHVGHGLDILTAQVARPDGVIVQAQESNYSFGPDAGSQPPGTQPLTLDQLVHLADDPAFTF